MQFRIDRETGEVQNLYKLFFGTSQQTAGDTHGRDCINLFQIRTTIDLYDLAVVQLHGNKMMGDTKKFYEFPMFCL